MLTFQIIWKFLYRQSSGDDGTQDAFRNQLQGCSHSKTQEGCECICGIYLYHQERAFLFLACACDILGLDEEPLIPAELKEAEKLSSFRSSVTVARLWKRIVH